MLRGKKAKGQDGQNTAVYDFGGMSKADGQGL